jgi:hypothetical protein
MPVRDSTRLARRTRHVSSRIFFALPPSPKPNPTCLVADARLPRRAQPIARRDLPCLSTPRPPRRASPLPDGSHLTSHAVPYRGDIRVVTGPAASRHGPTMPRRARPKPPRFIVPLPDVPSLPIGGRIGPARVAACPASRCKSAEPPSSLRAKPLPGRHAATARNPTVPLHTFLVAGTFALLGRRVKIRPAAPCLAHPNGPDTPSYPRTYLPCLARPTRPAPPNQTAPNLASPPLPRSDATRHNTQA